MQKRIIFLLFLLGLNLTPQKLWLLLRQTLWATLLTSLAFGAAGAAVAWLFGFTPPECALVGDTGADVAAARAAGARGVLVPNIVTRREEIDAAPEVAPDLGAAVDLLLGARP